MKLFVVAMVALWLGVVEGSAQTRSAQPNPPMRKARTMIWRQDPPWVFKEVAPLINPENSRVVVSLTLQRLWLMVDDQVYIDSPVSTGKRAGMTPTGTFTITQKDPNHRSNLYGAFVDSRGRVVRDGISLKVDSAPSGTRYVGAPMKWFMRLTNGGVGMHIGILPGYPASHGCVRVHAEMAPLIYQKVKYGTVVVIEP